MKKIFVLFISIILLAGICEAKDKRACYYKQYSALQNSVIAVPCEKSRYKRAYKHRRNIGAIYDQYGQRLGYKIKGDRVVAYDVDGRRTDYYRRLPNGRILKYDRSGRRIASYR